MHALVTGLDLLGMQETLTAVPLATLTKSARSAAFVKLRKPNSRGAARVFNS
jgi:hypothetical protein